MKKSPFTPLFAGNIIFIEDDHTYYVDVDGATKQMPSLSTVLKKQGLTPEYSGDIPEYVLKQAAARGQEIHTAIANELVGSSSDVRPENAYLFESAKKLYQDHAMEVTSIEVPLFNPVFDYCCTPDFVGLVDGRPAIVDWKTTTKIAPQAGFQLAGQALCYRHPEAFDLYIGDLRRGVLVPFRSELFLSPARAAFQLYNDVREVVEAHAAK
jgi:hypothetical protein